MANKTKIEWTEFNWNFLRGCSRVSEGCRNCYAEHVAHRFGGEGQPYEGLTVLGNDGKPRWNGKTTFHEDVLVKPLRWKKPRKIFVNSMSDLFHESVPFDVIDKAFAVMALTPQHTYQILTKRPERMREYLKGLTDERLEDACSEFSHNIDEWELPLKNVWLGVSVEDQKTADERIPILLDTPAAVRWISAEPLLGTVDLTRIQNNGRAFNALRGMNSDYSNSEILPDGPYKLHWIVVGGESGHDARPMHPDWARALRDQCVAAKVPFFFKQWGEWSPTYEKAENGKIVITEVGEGKMIKVGKKQAGRLLDGVEWNQYPEVAA